MTTRRISPARHPSGATVPAISLAGAFAVEAAYSAILVFVIMGVATPARAPRV